MIDSGSAPEDQELRQEFDALLRRADLLVPEARRHALHGAFLELRRMTALLRQPRTARNEPAATYSVARTLAGESGG